MRRFVWLPLLLLGADGGDSLDVVFTDVQTTSGCWYFSGPGDVGRYRQLGPTGSVEVRDGWAVVDLGGGAVFEGAVGGPLAARRQWRWDGGWTTAETLRGDVRDGGFCGTYAYEECDLERPPCPGRCRIDAKVAIGLAPERCSPRGREVSRAIPPGITPSGPPAGPPKRTPAP